MILKGLMRAREEAETLQGRNNTTNQTTPEVSEAWM